MEKFNRNNEKRPIIDFRGKKMVLRENEHLWEKRKYHISAQYILYLLKLICIISASVFINVFIVYVLEAVFTLSGLIPFQAYLYT